MPKDTIHSTFSRNPFAVFAPQPVGVYFDDQKKGEKIILLLRAHFVTLIPAILQTFFLILLPLVLIQVLGFLKVDIFSLFALRQLFLIALFWYLFTFGFAFYKFIFWYFNVYLLTNERIVDFDFKGIFHKEISYAYLSQIQDVNPKQIGFFATFFHYGDVFVQTAAQKQEFDFNRVEKPDIVAREILEQVRLESAEPPGVIA